MESSSQTVHTLPEFKKYEIMKRIIDKYDEIRVLNHELNELKRNYRELYNVSYGGVGSVGSKSFTWDINSNPIS